jgi:hypothetical protein
LGGVFYDEGKTIKEEEEKKSLHARAKSRKKSEKERNTHKDISPVHNLFIIPSALIYLWEG